MRAFATDRSFAEVLLGYDAFVESHDGAGADESGGRRYELDDSCIYVAPWTGANGQYVLNLQLDAAGTAKLRASAGSFVETRVDRCAAKE